MRFILSLRLDSSFINSRPGIAGQNTSLLLLINIVKVCRVFGGTDLSSLVKTKYCWTQHVSPSTYKYCKFLQGV